MVCVHSPAHFKWIDSHSILIDTFYSVIKKIEPTKIDWNELVEHNKNG